MRLLGKKVRALDFAVPYKLQAPLAVVVLVILCIQHFSVLVHLWDRYHAYSSLHDLWVWYQSKENREAVVPLATGIGGLIALTVAFGQFKTARLRHEEQTKADLQRRITESFSKATEQLGSEKIEVRLGGIYTLERLSKESPSDYWTVMETLTAFVRERAKWKEPEDSIFAPAQEAEQPRQIRCPTDIQAAMKVIGRRDEKSRKRERSTGWRIDLQGVDVRGVVLASAHLESAIFKGAHLEGADLSAAHLQGAQLREAHLEGAQLREAHLDGANLDAVHLEEANLIGAHLEGAQLREAHLDGARVCMAHLAGAQLREAHLEEADLTGADLEGAHLYAAHLEGADITRANFDDVEGADDSQMARARGDADTVLPKDIKRPAHWEQG